MAIRVGINGFGRIGRNVFRILCERKNVDVVGINDITDAKTLAHLLKYDTVMGRFKGEVSAEGQALKVNGKVIPITDKRNPAEIPWSSLGADIVVESTGLFARRADLEKHTAAGAKKVILTVPPGPPFPVELHNKKMCGDVWCYTGPLKQAEKVFKPIRAFKKPVLDFVGPIPHPALQGMFDPIFPTGLQWYWKADFMRKLNDDAIAQHVTHGARMPTWQSTMHLYPINGAAARIKNGATPWAYRDALFAQVMVGVDPDPANKDKLVTWARDYFNALHPHSAGGAYVNFMMEEGDDRVRATYGKNYPRLAKIKKKYDPKNFFRVNQNISPGK